jgi:delta-aminolevulinic acid dehydratase/porphobilinogen synthase
VELLSTTATDTAAARLAELRHRGLSNDAIEAALVRRQAVLQAKQGLDAMSPQRIQDGVLQLLRLLQRRQAAVLQGHLLPPADSLFAQTPL